jgi:aspartate beta-hydroxylase
MPEQEALASADGKAWRLFVAQAYGYKVPHAPVLAPVLCSLIAQCPDVLSATYSWIPAGKVIPSHRGPHRGILRYTLGLQVPEAQSQGERVSLVIDGKEHRLREGQSILWDDTYLHSSLNTTQQPRTVLLLDIRRRPLPFFLGLLNSVVIGITYFGAFLTLRKHAESIVNRARQMP